MSERKNDCLSKAMDSVLIGLLNRKLNYYNDDHKPKSGSVEFVVLASVFSLTPLFL